MEWLQSQFTLSNVLTQLMWAAIASMLMRLWLRFMGKPLDTKREVAFWILAPLTILILSSMTIFTNRPNFSVSVDQVHVAENPNAGLNKGANGTLVLLVISARNSGAPSIMDWGTTLTISSAAGEIIADGAQVPEIVTMKDEASGIETKFYGTDALYDKTTATPIATGAMVRGILLFNAQHLKKDFVSTPGTKLVVNYKDAMGQRHDVEFIWPLHPGKIGYIPGLH